MKLDVRFVCETCYKRYRETYEWIEHEWEGEGAFSRAMEHFRDHPDHEMSADTEINL